MVAPGTIAPSTLPHSFHCTEYLQTDNQYKNNCRHTVRVGLRTVDAAGLIISDGADVEASDCHEVKAATTYKLTSYSKIPIYVNVRVNGCLCIYE